MSETNRIEYKVELTKELDLEREVIAFLNYREGGVIYVGIDKRGNVVGVNDIDGDMLKIKDRIKMNIAPSAMGLFDVAVERINNIEVIKIVVASGRDKPYFKSKYGMNPKGAYIRVGTAAEPMPQNLIDNLFARRVRNSLGSIIANRQDLTFEQLRIYYDSQNKRLNDNFARSLELLTEDGKYNYAAYLLADENGNSIKVAKYSSLDRSDIVENNEYGYCSLIKATKSVIAKMEVENSVAAQIGYPERVETPMWDKEALRESIINCIVHNDFSFEVPPKFEIFPDRLEITSAGRIPDDIDEEEFFNGISSPRNKELMRVYRDLELVESLGYGVPRIVKTYGRVCFEFMRNFTRMVLPISKEYLEITGKQVSDQVTTQVTTQVTMQVTMQVTTQVEQLVVVIENDMFRDEIQEKLNLANREHFRKTYLNPAIQAGYVELTIPDKPTSRNQKYRLTEKGKELKGKL